MKTELFDYHLPPERIAQTPAKPRNASRLLVIDRNDGSIRADAHFFDLTNFLHPNDLIVWNDTKVFRARLRATKQRRQLNSRSEVKLTTRTVELFLVRPLDDTHWIAIARPAKHILAHDVLDVNGTSFTVEKKNEDGTIYVRSPCSAEETIAFANRVGSVPTPPYIHTIVDNDERYQTIYASRTGSVAAPTAGFHFTPNLIAALKTQGIRFAAVTLHVGLGTFLPIKTDTLEEHRMHAEWAELPAATVHAIEETKQKGGRIIAVGTTTVRVLEGTVEKLGSLRPFSGDLTTFIKPGWNFNIVDGLLTNFHLPKTTLLALVAAFLEPDGISCLHSIYGHALSNDYRFASFGDAMLVA